MKQWLSATIWLVCILFLGWIPSQSDFHLILPALFGAFGSYFYILKKRNTISFKWFLIIAIVARILIIPPFPNLSDDIYRFIWDGRLWHYGISPYTVLPSEINGINQYLSDNLFLHLNSPNYYSIYPPIAQAIFWISTLFPSSNLIVEVLIMKFVHFSFEIGCIFLLIKLLKQFSIESTRVFFYAFNPLIVLELIGNLHHEGIVIFFILLMLYFLHKRAYWKTGVAFGAAIATKILPILFGPLIFFKLESKARWQFISAAFISTSVLFLVVLKSPQTISHILKSANLYVQKFEFNGGLYITLRSIGYKIYDYNIIQSLGPIMIILSGLIILSLTTIKIKNKNKIIGLVHVMIWTYAAYAFFSPTLHPWYIAILIALSTITKFRYAILWSSIIMLTYINYSFEPYHEVLVLVYAEYLIVISFLIYEVRRYGWLGGGNRDKQ